jgi:putative intracellular protease/amidase
MNILMVLTSHDALGTTGEKTGFWVEEFAAPYYALTDAGATVALASPEGGQPPIDPKSEAPDAQTAATKRFYADADVQKRLANTAQLKVVNELNYDAVFYPGGHGPMWDLANDAHSIALIEAFYAHNKPIAFVCHAPAALVKTKKPNGEPLVKGKHVTGFSNTEEDAVKLSDIVPFLLEDELTKLGGIYSKEADWQVHVKHDGMLITGQNPASSLAAAQLLLEALDV